MLGLSQQDLAGHLNIASQQVPRYKAGKNRISGSRFYEASQVLKVPVSYFFERLSGNNKLTVDSPLTQPETLRLVANYSRIQEPSRRRAIYELVHSFAEVG